MGNSISRLAPTAVQDYLRDSASNYSRVRGLTSSLHETALSENVFESILTLECQRAERSRKPFVLMLLDANAENGTAASILEQAAEVALFTKRETDLVGWYSQDAILGVIFTEVNLEGDRPITETLRARIETKLTKQLGRDRAAKIAISMHVFPEGQEKNRTGHGSGSKIHADQKRNASRRRMPAIIK